MKWHYQCGQCLPDKTDHPNKKLAAKSILEMEFHIFNHH